MGLTPSPCRHPSLGRGALGTDRDAGSPAPPGTAPSLRADPPAFGPRPWGGGSGRPWPWGSLCTPQVPVLPQRPWPGHPRRRGFPRTSLRTQGSPGGHSPRASFTGMLSTATPPELPHTRSRGAPVGPARLRPRPLLVLGSRSHWTGPQRCEWLSGQQQWTGMGAPAGGRGVTVGYLFPSGLGSVVWV